MTADVVSLEGMLRGRHAARRRSSRWGASGCPRCSATTRSRRPASRGSSSTHAVRTAHPAEYAGAAATVLVKVVLIPLGLLFTARRLGEMLRLKPITRPVVSYALAVGRAGRRVPDVAPAAARTSGRRRRPATSSRSGACSSSPLALIFLGFLTLIIRRDLFSQIIGFLTVENGISAFAVVALGGVPFLTEMGIFAAIGSGVVLMAVLSQPGPQPVPLARHGPAQRPDRLTCCCSPPFLVPVLAVALRGRREGRPRAGTVGGRRQPGRGGRLRHRGGPRVRARPAPGRRRLDGRPVRRADDRPHPDRLDGGGGGEHALRRPRSTTPASSRPERCGSTTASCPCSCCRCSSRSPPTISACSGSRSRRRR